MIIQCEKCQTRFRLDDSRVTSKGVKVRCTKCKHVFAVRKEEPDAEFLPPGGAIAELSPPVADAETPAVPAEEWSFAEESAPSPADSTVFDDTTFDSEPVRFSPLESPPHDTAEFSFDTVSSNIEEPETPVTESGTLFSFDTAADVPVDQEKNDFGAELASVAVQQGSPDDLKPSQEILVAPPVEPTVTPADETLTQSFPEEAAVNEQQELPPLSIPSRRKQSPVFAVLITVVALLVISVLGYLGYSTLSTPKETAPPESGKISLRAVTTAFVENAAAGKLLVVSGEALNEYAKPRAALQIMVTVYDAAGQSVATKSAYGGNPLTKEQLEKLPLDKIEAAMANPFGDSLVNMGVAPGKAIPFVVVLANLPAGAKDFSVQSAGSTVATGK
jgi:predicted Zn finger-like uncharacterized protein